MVRKKGVEDLRRSEVYDGLDAVFVRQALSV